MNYLFNRVIYLITLSFMFLSYADASCPALFYAVIEKEVEIVKTYLQYGADPNASLENCPLSEFKLKLPTSTPSNPLFFQDLQEDFFIDYPEGTTLLHIAVYISAYGAYGDHAIYSLLYTYGADDSVMDVNSNSPRSFRGLKACVSPYDLQLTKCF